MQSCRIGNRRAFTSSRRKPRNLHRTTGLLIKCNSFALSPNLVQQTGPYSPSLLISCSVTTAYPPRQPRGPPPADAGTLENPRRILARPDPVLPNVGVKEDNTPPEDLQDVRTQLNPPTASRGDVEMQRANRDRIGDPIPPGHQAHHGAPKNSGGETGESVRDILRIAGVKVDAPEASLAARGVTRETVPAIPSLIEAGRSVSLC